jgi:geranylgeranylglycerol-phosphate geranylgeranyltransferase
MIGLAVIIGEIMVTDGNPELIRMVWGFLTGFLICGYSMVTNDVYDAEIDAINQPKRPIPSGKISIKDAKYLSFTLLALGLLFSIITFNAYAILISILYSFLSWLYNSRLKKEGIAGNAVVSSSLAIPFVYGGFLYGIHSINPLLLIMALTSFVAGLGRELVKGIADVRGDREKGVMSFAVSHGEKKAAELAASTFLLAVVLSWLPILIKQANTFYTYGILIPDFIFIYLAVASLGKINSERALRIKNIALLGMLSGLIVFIGGAI